MAEYYVVTDNASIHTPAAVRALVENRGYKCLYLPPLSPLLNPIEEFWAKGKAGIRRTPLSVDGQLSDRICESVNKVEHCLAWIRHTISSFPKCKEVVRNL